MQRIGQTCVKTKLQQNRAVEGNEIADEILELEFDSMLM
jgi:hypothetical protein